MFCVWQARSQAARLPPKPAGVRWEEASMARASARPPYSSSSPQAVPLSIPGARPSGCPLLLPHLELVGNRSPQKWWLQRPNLLRLKLLRRRVTIMCTFECRGRRWRQWLTGSPRRCVTMFHRALGHRMQRQLFTPFRFNCQHRSLSQQWRGDPGTISYERVSVLQLNWVIIRTWIRWRPNRIWRP